MNNCCLFFFRCSFSSRNFAPDSGRLVHLRTPNQTETVRIDAGFIAGDEVSSHYDPMIAKLIVGAPSRGEAIQKLRVALSEYEIVGPATNIEFLKKLCESPAFIAGNVETGYIQKYSDELFAQILPEDEVFAQAALGLLMQEIVEGKVEGVFGSLDASMGLMSGLQHRCVPIIHPSPGGTGDAVQVDVKVHQTGPATFDIRVNNSFYPNVTSRYEPSSRVLTSYFPHARLSTTIVRNGNSATVFHRGKQYRLEYVPPKWIEEALEVKNVANSVLTPMPCKVIRVEVHEGDTVTKDQVLVVIESMKMEMAIRSPQDGVISRVVHQEGVGAPSENVCYHNCGCSQLCRTCAKQEQLWWSLQGAKMLYEVGKEGESPLLSCERHDYIDRRRGTGGQRSQAERSTTSMDRTV